MPEVQTITRNTHANKGKAAGLFRPFINMMPKTDQVSSPPAREADAVESHNLKVMHVIVCGNKDVIKEIVGAIDSSNDALGLKSMENAVAEYKPNCVSICIKLKVFDPNKAYEELQDRFFYNVTTRCRIGIKRDQEEDIIPVFDSTLDSLNLSFQAAF